MAAICRNSCLVPSPQSSVLCFAGLLISASSPPCGRENLSFPHTEQQPGTQCRASGLLVTRGVLNMSIITVSRGRWRRAFLAHHWLFVASERGWLLATEVGRGCCVGKWCGQQDTAPRGAGGQEEGSRGSGGSFHSQGQIILSRAGRGCLWERTGNHARFPCMCLLRLFLFTPVLISLLNQPSCLIFTFACAAGQPL